MESGGLVHIPFDFAELSATEGAGPAVSTCGEPFDSAQSLP